jgi:hypothetical protein
MEIQSYEHNEVEATYKCSALIVPSQNGKEWALS